MSMLFAADDIRGSADFNLSPWTSHCTKENDLLKCGIPRQISKAQSFHFEFNHSYEPGTALKYSLPFDFEQPVTGEVSVYSVMSMDPKIPPYLQIQILMYEPFYLFCASSVRWQRPFEMPPLLCAGLDGELRIGFTLVSTKMEIKEN
jgi:hypothetical protein